jgi:ubiquinone/menaquinone biosynthesis C-methylase UbiE
MTQTLNQIARVCKKTGLLAIVDVGKPGSSVRRFFLSAYLLFAMPLIARLLTIGRVSGNPWRMLLPTYLALPTNQEIAEMLATRFRQVDTKEFMMDGMVVFLARGIV